MTYDEFEYGGQTIYKPATATVYRDAAGTQAIVTEYAYEWFQESSTDTLALKSVTTTLPPVPSGQNGDGTPATTYEEYDEYGFTKRTIDERGTETFYTNVDALKGGATQRIDNYVGGTPGDDENLTTDMELDYLGRTTAVLGPAHTIDLAGTATEVRTAQWTQYRDTEDMTVRFGGYVKTSGSEHLVNPVMIDYRDREDATDGWRMASQVSAAYTPTLGDPLPPVDHDYLQPTWTRWSSRHFDKGGMERYSRLYHLIPDSDSGSSGTNYAQTGFGYDILGRRNQTTTPQGTIAKQTFDALGWLLKEEVGTGAGMVQTTAYAYEGLAGLDGKVSAFTALIDGNSLSPDSSSALSSEDRITYYDYDWRDRLEKTTLNDGTREYFRTRAHDNLGQVTEEASYHTAVSSGNLIGKQASDHDNRGRVYERRTYPEGGTNPLTALSYYDAAGELVREEHAGSEGFTVQVRGESQRMVSTGSLIFGSALHGSARARTGSFGLSATIPPRSHSAVRISPITTYHSNTSR
jgi:hypothetical protein